MKNTNYIMSWSWGDNTLQDVENIRKSLIDGPIPWWDKEDIIDIFSRIIEVGLRRQLIINEKSKENETINYKERFEDLYKWFCYYQDKCKELENALPSTQQ